MLVMQGLFPIQSQPHTDNAEKWEALLDPFVKLHENDVTHTHTYVKKKVSVIFNSYFGSTVICDAGANVIVMVYDTGFKHFNLIRFRWMQQMLMCTRWP